MVRFREDTPELQQQAREAVAAWRAANPGADARQMAADLKDQFPASYEPVLRTALYAIDRDAALRDRGPIT
jgi:hypothetical protein